MRTIGPLAAASEWLTWPATGSVSGGSTSAEVSMSRNGRNDESGTKASGPWDRPRHQVTMVNSVLPSPRARRSISSVRWPRTSV
jgi:hypothetical protein